MYFTWENLEWVWWNECVLGVREFGAGFGVVCVCCCLWDSLVCVWGRVFVLCVGQFGLGLGE